MTTKVCNRCKTEKPITDFYKNKARPDGHNYSCKKCQLQLNAKTKRESTAEWQRRNKNRQFIDRYKTYCGCQECGYKAHPAALDFVPVHDAPEGTSAIRTYWGRTKIKKIARYCVILCANCHRIHTHGGHHG
jgi:hypothetical protein